MASKPITGEQLEKLIKETQKEISFVADRDTLYYEILFYLGLRPGEARLIEISHIDFKEQSVFIPAQNNKERHADDVFIPNFLFKKIKSYLSKRKYFLKFLFPSYHRRNFPVDSRSLQRNFITRTLRLGINFVSYFDRQDLPRYAMNLYSFRKAFGTFVYVKTRDPKITASLLRQYDPALKSVWRYISFAEKENRKELMKMIYSKKVVLTSIYPSAL